MSHSAHRPNAYQSVGFQTIKKRMTSTLMEILPHQIVSRRANVNSG